MSIISTPIFSEFFSKLFAFKQNNEVEDGKLIVETQEVDRVWIEFFEDIVKNLDNISTLNGILIITGGIRYTTTVVTDATYTVLSTDNIIFCDTDLNAITANLPAGLGGRHYKLINCGSSGNDLTVQPDGLEELYGTVIGSVLSDGEVIDIHFSSTQGWW